MSPAGGYNDVERGLLLSHTAMFVASGAPEHEAETLAKEMLDQCISEAKADGTYDSPPGLGDLVLGLRKAPSPEYADWAERQRERIPRLREEGVTDGDIRTWWNLPDIEARMTIAADNNAHMARVLNEIAEGRAYDSGNTSAVAMAMVAVRKAFPLYGDPDDTRNTTGDDRPLPYELKDRVNRYIERQASSFALGELGTSSASTFNTLVRREIRAGNL
ncbi:MAG: hypothetical protein OXP66_15725 [Candidatus Tectomicrobia bacterium]|nr:hypothetical protein [Candidatus Tectomicrobia bacterium]